MDTYVGFDSAWAGNPKMPGAICAVTLCDGHAVDFHAPQLASFEKALAFIREVRSGNGVTLIALDQPTIVPNPTGSRPLERVAGSLISWLGGGVQPSNRGKRGMFSDDAPIWPFLGALGAKEDPEQARAATSGLHLMEVFPALALPSLDPRFFGQRRAPKYNPANKKEFNLGDWVGVAKAAGRRAYSLNCKDLAEWCMATAQCTQPRKADQDKLDAVICVLIALHWRLSPREASMILGDLTNGYMVLPATPQVRERLTAGARKRSVTIEGAVPEP